MRSVTLDANAKINLYLDITGRRSDGYHLLETVMHGITLHDTVTVEMAESDIFVTCDNSSIACDETNIAYKCASAFFSYSGINNKGVRIHIEKNIPTGAGMGGGSADGAAVLRGMNILFGTGFDEDQLCSVGTPVGADIPFCIKSGCGYCTGIGEIIELLPVLNGFVLIGKGTEGISTKDAFDKIDNSDFRIGINGIKEIFSDVNDISKIAPYCRNIFDIVTSLEEVNDIRRIMLENNAVCACMTGSGSAVFGLYDTVEEAERTSRILKKSGYFSAVCEFAAANSLMQKD